jgi:hypothetical protein
MAIIVEPLHVSGPAGAPALEVVRAGIHEMDDCPVLRRVKAFIVDQGVAATLEHVFRDRRGRAVDLSGYLDVEGALSDSSSSLSTVPEPGGGGTAVLRVKDALAHGPVSDLNPVWELPVTSHDPLAGVLQATLREDIVERAGIYQLSWAIRNGAGKVVLVNDGLLSVERSLYPLKRETLADDLGPPTINEIRMAMMDSDPAENQYLLDNVEFADDQLLQAILEPVQAWNEIPPPVRTFTPRDFPFRFHWKQGIIARLHIYAAHHYRRNALQHQAGGVAIADKNKESEYLAYGQQLWNEYMTWLYNKKVEINLKGFLGEVRSAYSYRVR